MRYIAIQKTRLGTNIWIADEDDLVDQANAEAGRFGTVAYEVSTAAELAHDYGLTPSSPAEAFAKADAEWILELGQKWGWNTPLYRADYLREEGLYSPEPVSPVEAAGAFYAGDAREFALMPLEVARERRNALIERFPEAKRKIKAELAD